MSNESCSHLGVGQVVSESQSIGERTRVINLNFMLTTLYAGKDENRKYAAKQHSTLGPVQMIFAKPTERRHGGKY